MKNQTLSLTLTLTILTALSACGGGDKDALFNLEAYEPIGDAEPANLSDEEVTLMTQSVSAYTYVPESEDPQSLDQVMEQVSTQMRNFNGAASVVDLPVSQSANCYVAGSVELSGHVRSEVEQQAENSNQFYFEGSGTKKMMGCQRGINSNAIPMSGEIAGDFKALVRGKAVYQANSTSIDQAASDLTFIYTADFNGSVKRDTTEEKSEVKNFGLAIKFTSAEMNELREATADPLGEEAAREARNAWFRQHIRCRGEVILKDKTYSCRSIVSYYIHQILNMSGD